MTESPCPSTEPIAQLLRALQRLEAYVGRDTGASSGSHLSKTFSKIRTLFTSQKTEPSRQTKPRYRIPSDEEMQEAVEIINRSRFLIEKLKEGTAEEQHIAETLATTVAKYNAGCELRIKRYMERQHSPFHLFRDKRGEVPQKIALPAKVTVSQHYPGKGLPFSPLTGGTARAAAAASVLIPKQSAELFHMKVLALLERYGIASNHEARTLIKEAPIRAEAGNDPAVCTLVQTLTLFPGQTITVKGSSSLDAKTHTIQRLIPETFSLTLESTQTGFPHPTQHNGWALAVQLLPDFPQRTDLLSTTASLFQKRHRVIAGLQPQGDLLKKAKGLVAARKQTFNKHSTEFLALQKELALAIVRQGAGTRDIAACEKPVDRFYECLAADPCCFDLLAESYRLIRDFFITKPHQKLINGIIKGKSTPIGSQDPVERSSAVECLFIEAQAEALDELIHHLREGDRRVADYILTVGGILGDAAKGIILQYLSEDLVYPPRELTPFQSAIQAAAYRQLENFVDELLEEGSAATMYEQMRNALAEEILLIKQEQASEVSEELADYFQQRHVSLC